MLIPRTKIHNLQEGMVVAALVVDRGGEDKKEVVGNTYKGRLL